MSVIINSVASSLLREGGGKGRKGQGLDQAHMKKLTLTKALT